MYPAHAVCRCRRHTECAGYVPGPGKRFIETEERNMTVRHNPRRRGALLLVILALLTMFGLVAVAFVVLTQQARSGAKAMARIDQSADPPQKVCDQAMRQLLRGSNNPASRIGPHSLLETMYGNGWFQTPLTGVTSACGGQLLEVTFANPGRVVGGCVITMLTGNCAGQSSYIVGLNPTSGNPQIAAFDNVVPGNAKTLPAVGDMCLINGTPWSGLGLGYNTSTGSLNAMSGSYEIALLPGYPLSNYTATAGNPPGGANTDYTAADFQHMLLAAQEPVNTGAPIPPLGTPLPSMHRPDLINYWMHRTSAGAWTTLDPVLLRQIMLRPNPIDHPNFTGSNPSFNPVSGPWDVDNDGDGVADSVWVDLGMPVRTMADGRLYKPLFAILCVDLDGRLNLNAHGNLGQANAGAPYLSTPQPSSGGFATAANEFIASSGLASASGNPATQSAVLPRGLGYGPAEINLLPAFTDLSGNNQFALYNNLLAGSTSLGVAGRYAELGSTAEPGVPNVMAPLTYNKWYDYGAINNVSNYYWNYQNPATYQADAYGTPPDPYAPPK